MLNWRGGLGFTIGCNAFLIASLPNDVIVVREASPESVFRQQPVKIDKRAHRNERRTDLHRRANRRIEHPCRHDDRRAKFPFDNDNLGPGTLLTIETSKGPAVERTPSIMDLHFLPDMGRITPRLPWGAKTFSSPAPIAAGGIGR
jgi:hypothetical protein